MTCLLCQRDLADDEQQRVACRHCQTRLHRQLLELPSLYRQLGEHLGPAGSTQGPRVSGSKPRRLPVNEEVLELRAWGGMVTELQAHEDDWRRHLGLPVAPWRGSVEQTLTGVVGFLAGHLWWACEKYPHIDGLDEDVKKVASAARSIVDPPERTIRIGNCPAAYEDGAICGAVLRALPGDTEITCRWCGAIYPESTWLQLRAVQPTLIEREAS